MRQTDTNKAFFSGEPVAVMHGANAPLMKVRDRNIYKNNWKGWCVCLFVCCVCGCVCVYLCTSVSIFAPSSPSVPAQIIVTEEVEREKRVLARVSHITPFFLIELSPFNHSCHWVV